MGVNGYLTKRILELNPTHPIVAKLHEKFDANKDDPSLKDAGELLVEYAQISEGGEIQNPLRFNELLLKLMEKGI
jgi:molecular chaperone HtpG